MVLTCGKWGAGNFNVARGALVLLGLVLVPRPSEGAAARFGPPEPPRDLREAAAPTSDELLEERLEYLDAAFDDMRPGGIVWVAFWAAVYQGLFAYQLTEAVRGTESWMTSRPASIVGAVECEISFVLTVALPFRPMTARRQFHEEMSPGLKSRARRLARGERLLLAAKGDVDFMRSWISHVAYIGMSLVGGAIVWGIEGRDGWKHALISAGGGIALGIVNIWSTPIKALKHHAVYTGKYGEIGEPAVVGALDIQWGVAPGPAGVTAWLLF